MTALMLVIAEVYIRASLGTRRLVAVAASPMITHFNDALSGNIVIRAFGRQGHFLKSNMQKVDTYMRALRVQYGLNRWLGNWLSLAQFALPIAAGLIAIHSSMSMKSIGFCLTVLVSFSDNVNRAVRSVNDVEIELNSCERIQHYIHDIDQEATSRSDYDPPASWPTTGTLDVQGMSVRYHPDGPDILKDISFRVQAGERIGIVGASGVGKSSLAISLLRFTYMATGSVYLDGRDISKTNLHALRRKITFIPQDPACLRGTVRFNLDPFEELDDAELNSALIASGLGPQNMMTAPLRDSHSSQGEVDSESIRVITLETYISHGGENLSQGQRQLLAFARALVRRSKLIILDEATSYTDAATDSRIQETIRTSFRGCSVLTIAHRLRSVVGFDRILVLQNRDGQGGTIAEFDTPRRLLAKTDGVLHRFAKDTGEFDELTRLAQE